MKEKFTLSTNTVFYESGEIGLILKPENSYLSDKIQAEEKINSNSDLNVQIEELKVIFTPIIFNKIQEMENIPNIVKESIYL